MLTSLDRTDGVSPDFEGPGQHEPGLPVVVDDENMSLLLGHDLPLLIEPAQESEKKTSPDSKSSGLQKYWRLVGSSTPSLIPGRSETWNR